MSLFDDKISILIVDDEEDLLEMYRELFEMDGFLVTTATSAQEGLVLYQKNQDIKVIISDSKMGDMSGIDFLSVLKNKYQTIPVFYLATGASDKTEDEIKSLGGAGLVLKPFDLDEILLRIKKDLNL